MILRFLLATGVLIVSIWADASSAQDFVAGEAAFRKCQPCHDVGEQARNKLGPQLNGLEGRKAGTTEGYDFSEANKNSGIVWSEELFREYIQDPQTKMPGTKMIFSDKNEKEIGNLWAYLKQFGADGRKK
jgi:cytochrome c